MYFLSNLIRFTIYIALYGILSVCSLQRVKVLFIFGLLYCLHLTTRLRPYISLSSQRYFLLKRESFFKAILLVCIPFKWVSLFFLLILNDYCIQYIFLYFHLFIYFFSSFFLFGGISFSLAILNGDK